MSRLKTGQKKKGFRVSGNGEERGVEVVAEFRQRRPVDKSAQDLRTVIKTENRLCCREWRRVPAGRQQGWSKEEGQELRGGEEESATIRLRMTAHHVHFHKSTAKN